MHTYIFSFDTPITSSIFRQLAKDIKPFMSYDELSGLSLTSAPVMLYRERVPAQEFESLEKLWQKGPSNYHEVLSNYSFV